MKKALKTLLFYLKSRIYLLPRKIGGVEGTTLPFNSDFNNCQYHLGIACEFHNFFEVFCNIKLSRLQ